MMATDVERDSFEKRGIGNISAATHTHTTESEGKERERERGLPVESDSIFFCLKQISVFDLGCLCVGSKVTQVI